MYDANKYIEHTHCIKCAILQSFALYYFIGKKLYCKVIGIRKDKAALMFP